MPLDVVRLGDSDLFALSTGDEFKAAVALWCKSWLQVPAASLPTDDRVLAHLSSAGAKWKKVKAIALRGWVECSDGRLYHPVIAEKAIEAMARRQEHESNKAQNNQRKQQEREDRKQMFAELRELGKVVAWDTTTSQLRDLLSQAKKETSHIPVTVTGHAGHEDVTYKTGTGTGTILKDLKDLSSAAAEDIDQPPCEKPKAKPERIPYDAIFDLYNEIVAAPFRRPAVKVRDDERKRLIKKVWGMGEKTKTLDWWQIYFTEATQSERWMNGSQYPDGSWWPGADFDFLVNVKRVKKIVEGAA